jgi:hypothetical protein
MRESEHIYIVYSIQTALDIANNMKKKTQKGSRMKEIFSSQ